MLKRALDRMALDGDVVVGSFRQYACSHGNRNEPPPVTRGSRHARDKCYEALRTKAIVIHTTIILKLLHQN